MINQAIESFVTSVSHVEDNTVCDFCGKLLGMHGRFKTPDFVPKKFRDGRLGGYFVHQGWCEALWDALKREEE